MEKVIQWTAYSLPTDCRNLTVSWSTWWATWQLRALQHWTSKNILRQNENFHPCLGTSSWKLKWLDKQAGDQTDDHKVPWLCNRLMWSDYLWCDVLYISSLSTGLKLSLHVNLLQSHGTLCSLVWWATFLRCFLFLSKKGLGLKPRWHTWMTHLHALWNFLSFTCKQTKIQSLQSLNPRCAMIEAEDSVLCLNVKLRNAFVWLGGAATRMSL